MATVTEVNKYNLLLIQAHKRIQNQQTLPYYEIFDRREEQKREILRYLILINYLLKRKYNLLKIKT